MLNIDESIKRSLESFGYKKSILINLEVADITSDLISQDSLTITQGLSSKDNYSVGNTICSELNFSIINNNNKYSESSFFNKVVSVKANIETADRIIKEFNCGKYICQRPKINNSGKIDIIAYDFMIKLDVNADRFLNTLTYPIKTVDFIRKACEYVGIEHDVPDDITNGDFMIKSRPESQKLNLRNLMSMALSIVGGNGRINIDTNKFEVAYLTDVNYKIPNSVHLDTIEIEDYNIAQIECVVASNKEDKDVIYGDRDSFVYYMDNNELIYGNTDEEIVNMLGRVLPRLQNINYKPFSLSIKRGLMFIQPGDIISYEYNGKEYKAPVLSRTCKGIYLEDTIEADGSENRDRLREDTISSGQVSGIASSGFDRYSLTSTKRYFDSTGEVIIAMGMYHSNVDKELIFKPDIFAGEYLGMETNFQEKISNSDIIGDPDMTPINKE